MDCFFSFFFLDSWKVGVEKENLGIGDFLLLNRMTGQKPLAISRHDKQSG